MIGIALLQALVAILVGIVLILRGRRDWGIALIAFAFFLLAMVGLGVGFFSFLVPS